ncbi:hypothetical protein Hanom_Chr03g00219991 [Helianthus anomalus]
MAYIFSQLHPLAFMRIVHFELSCVAFYDEPSIPLFVCSTGSSRTGTGLHLLN